MILQPYDMEMGAGTFHPATTLRALGPDPWNAAFVQPCRRPTDGRYGENPNRLQHYYQYQVILKPSPPDLQELYLGSLAAIGVDMRAPRHPLRRGRLGEPDARRLGARLGSLVRRDGGDAVHLFPADGRLRLQARRGRADLRARTAGDVHPGRRQRLRPRVQRCRRDATATCSSRTSARCRRGTSRSPTPTRCSTSSARRAAECENCLAAELPIPAYEQAIKASHIFNLLQARGVISVAERQAYIGRVRDLAKGACAAWMDKNGWAA